MLAPFGILAWLLAATLLPWLVLHLQSSLRTPNSPQSTPSTLRGPLESRWSRCARWFYPNLTEAAPGMTEIVTHGALHPVDPRRYWKVSRIREKQWNPRFHSAFHDSPPFSARLVRHLVDFPSLLTLRIRTIAQPRVRKSSKRQILLALASPRVNSG